MPNSLLLASALKNYSISRAARVVPRFKNLVVQWLKKIRWVRRVAVWLALVVKRCKLFVVGVAVCHNKFTVWWGSTTSAH